MLTFFSNKTDLKTALKVLNHQARVSLESYSSMIKSIEDRLTIMEQDIREIKSLHEQVFKKAVVISK
tara:strand:+ start:322 stop:522 length:201 start_codon:yes stop_codon:yes gene_type:complete